MIHIIIVITLHALMRPFKFQMKRIPSSMGNLVVQECKQTFMVRR